MVWSYVQTIGTEGFALLTTFILAGIFGPELFGLVALGIVYVMFVQMILQQGMIPAIIQRRDLRDIHLDSAFWLVMTATGVLSIATIALAGWWADFNNEPDLQSVTIALAALVPIRGLIVVQDAILRRSMDFKSLAKRNFAAVIAGGVVGIGMALAGFGVWSLVGQHLVRGLVDVAMLWSISSWRPRRRFSREAAGDLLRFSGGASLGAFGVFVADRADVVLTGAFFGATAVGLYRFVARLVEMATNFASGPLLQVSLPEFSRLQNDRAQLGDRIVEFVKIAALLSLPLFATMAASSDDLIALLGDEWAPASDALKILCFVGAARSLGVYSTTILQAIGKPAMLALTEWSQAGIKVVTLLVGAMLVRDSSTTDQVVGIAVTVATAEVLMALLVSVPVMVHYGNVALTRLLRAPATSAIASAAGFVVASGFRTLPVVGDFPALVRLILTSGLALIVIGAVLFAIEPMARDALRDRVLGPLRNRAVTNDDGRESTQVS